MRLPFLAALRRAQPCRTGTCLAALFMRLGEAPPVVGQRIPDAFRWLITVSIASGYRHNRGALEAPRQASVPQQEGVPKKAFLVLGRNIRPS